MRSQQPSVIPASDNMRYKPEQSKEFSEKARKIVGKVFPNEPQAVYHTHVGFPAQFKRKVAEFCIGYATVTFVKHWRIDS